MEHTLPGRIGNNVRIDIIDVTSGNIIKTVEQHNRLVMRYHLVITHLLSPVGNALLQSELSAEDFAKLGIPTSDDLKITKMRFGTGDSTTAITMEDLEATVAPGYTADGTPITDGTDYYAIDGYKFANGTEIDSIKDYDQAITFETTMAGPQGNSATVDPITYREAGLYTANDIMFARTQLPALQKTENFAFRMSWSVRLP